MAVASPMEGISATDSNTTPGTFSSKGGTVGGWTSVKPFRQGRYDGESAWRQMDPLVIGFAAGDCNETWAMSLRTYSPPPEGRNTPLKTLKAHTERSPASGPKWLSSNVLRTPVFRTPK